MRRDRDGIWLTEAEWIPWVMRHHPERIREVAAAEPQEIDARTEARQWRAGRAQGLLKPTSPLRSEQQRRAQSGNLAI